ncbi:MAG: helix-turn-helix domain-containing protein [Candidatus Nanopelagicales bacterium]
MSKARLVITAVELEGRSPAEVAASYGVSRSWVYELLARYRAEGDTALEPRSRRPRTNPRATPQPVVDLVLALRDQLDNDGLDAGAHTLAWHLREHHATTVSVSTIWRILHRAGRIDPQPHKRPAPPTSASRPPCPTRPGRPTSPTSPSPTARTRRS